MRSHYDRESTRPNQHGNGRREYFSERQPFISGEQTFKGAVVSILNEFLVGDFALVRKLLEALNKQYPSLVNEEVIGSLSTPPFWVDC